ncbi:hypothetical protein [Hyphobacterium sp.]|uniref:hypothetical protein n=1 Tax=Hyphobacterium sp. TaxID=2004662 RepID=UPI003B52E6C2
MTPPFYVIWFGMCAGAFVCVWTGLRWIAAVRSDPHLSPWRRKRDRELAGLVVVAGGLLALAAFISSAFVAVPIWGWL